MGSGFTYKPFGYFVCKKLKLSNICSCCHALKKKKEKKEKEKGKEVEKLETDLGGGFLPSKLVILHRSTPVPTLPISQGYNSMASQFILV